MQVTHRGIGWETQATRMAEAKPTVCEVDFASFCATGSKNVPRQAEALLEWWKSFQQTGFQRKNPDCSIILSCNGVLRITGVEDTANAEHKIRSSMKKIKAEDLGNMQAPDLLASIPEEDPQGRGLRDMREMERKLSVKVYFDTSLR